jgi:hypothetical protein
MEGGAKLRGGPENDGDGAAWIPALKCAGTVAPGPKCAADIAPEDPMCWARSPKVGTRKTNANRTTRKDLLGMDSSYL